MSKHNVDRRIAPVWFTQISIHGKLILNAAVPFILFLAFTLWQTWSLASLETRVSEVRRDAHASDLVRQMQTDVVQVQQFLSDVSATRAQDGLDDGFKEAQGHHDEFLAKLKQLPELSPDVPTTQLEQVRQSFER